MICKHCGQEIKLTTFKLPTEQDIYLHVETNIRTCYDLDTDTYHIAQPK